MPCLKSETWAQAQIQVDSTCSSHARTFTPSRDTVNDTHTHLCISGNNCICKELMSHTPTPMSLFSLTLSLYLSHAGSLSRISTHRDTHTWVAVVSFCESELSEGTVWAFVKTENCRGREIHFQLRQEKKKNEAFSGKSHCTCSVLKTAACKLN